MVGTDTPVGVRECKGSGGETAKKLCHRTCAILGPDVDAYFIRRQTSPAQTTSPITAIKVGLPPDGSTNRQVTNFLCPSQLPNGAIDTTTSTYDTLVCSGGSLALEERLSVHIRMDPPPTSGMDGQLFGQQDGSFKGPFGITGP